MSRLDDRAMATLEQVFAESNWQCSDGKWTSNGGVTVEFVEGRAYMTLAPAQLVMLLNTGGISMTELDDALDAATRQLCIPDEAANALRLEIKVALANDNRSGVLQH